MYPQVERAVAAILVSSKVVAPSMWSSGWGGCPPTISRLAVRARAVPRATLRRRLRTARASRIGPRLRITSSAFLAV